MGSIGRIEQLEVAAIQVDAVKVSVVRILTGLAAVGAEEKRPALFVNSLDVIADKLARGELSFERSAAVVKIEVTPAVTLRPVNQLLTVVDEAQWFGLDVGIQPFLDERFHFARFRVGDANIDLLHVAAGAAEVKLVRGFAQPFGFDPLPLASPLLLLLLLLILILFESSLLLPLSRR